jgi:hypothetical protein
MTIILNHTIVPARDKVAAARFFSQAFSVWISISKATTSRRSA